VQINGYDQQFTSNSVLHPLCFANAKPKIVNNAGFTSRTERSICRVHGMVDSSDHADASTPRRGVFHPRFLGGRQIECAAEIKCSHRVVSSDSPVDSDVEVHPYCEALLFLVIMLVGTLGALHTDFVLDVLPEGFFC
jgi:hypothetical protein